MLYEILPIWPRSVESAIFRPKPTKGRVVMLEYLLSSDVTLVLFSLLLGALVGVVGERHRRDRQDQSRLD
jgi:hypothetical protein